MSNIVVCEHATGRYEETATGDDISSIIIIK